MKVEIKLSADIEETYAVIYTDTITDEIKKLSEILQNRNNSTLIGDSNGRFVILKPEEIFMVKVENKEVFLYTKDKKYASSKRLYEIEKEVSSFNFMRISKSVLINLKQIDFVEPGFNGVMEIILKNGLKDYISRKYVPDLKKYLGL